MVLEDLEQLLSFFDTDHPCLLPAPLPLALFQEPEQLPRLGKDTVQSKLSFLLSVKEKGAGKG